MEENNFKVGDRVTLSSYGKSMYDDDQSNPHNMHGQIMITNDSICHRIVVSWSNGNSNNYSTKELELVNKKELVNSPDHYKSKGMEAIDVIEGFGLGFNLGNATKYILRCGKKDDAIQELILDLGYRNAADPSGISKERPVPNSINAPAGS